MKLTINDIEVEVAEGTTVLEAAKAAQVRIPTLSRLTDGRTGGDIAFVCRKASMMAIREHIKSECEVDPLLEWRHFEAALKELKGTTA